RVIKTIQLKAEYPEYIAVTPDQKYAYITHPPTNRISVINLANSTLLRTFTCLGQPEGLAMTLDNRYVYIAQYEKKRIAIFNRSSGNFLKTINVGRGPREIVITQDD
ncbi:MAG: YncE family protein, partial [Chitinophagales bacterium]